MSNGRPNLSELCNVETLVYRILREMMLVDEMDYETYKRFTKRFKAELANRGKDSKIVAELIRRRENEETHIY